MRSAWPRSRRRARRRNNDCRRTCRARSWCVIAVSQWQRARAPQCALLRTMAGCFPSISSARPAQICFPDCDSHELRPKKQWPRWLLFATSRTWWTPSQTTFWKPMLIPTIHASMSKTPCRWSERRKPGTREQAALDQQKLLLVSSIRASILTIPISPQTSGPTPVRLTETTSMMTGTGLSTTSAGSTSSITMARRLVA